MTAHHFHAGRTPLTDVRVLEIGSRTAGAYCGKLLTDAGADVVKIEPPSGDVLRRTTATNTALPPGVDAPLFSYLNAGKRSVVTPPRTWGSPAAR